MYGKLKAPLIRILQDIYDIVGNFGKVSDLEIWRSWVKIAKLKTYQFKLDVCTPMTLSIQIAKFKSRQHQLRAISPNLILTKMNAIQYAQI